MKELSFWHSYIIGVALTLSGCATPREVITRDNLQKVKLLRRRNELDYIGAIFFLTPTGMTGIAFSPDSKLMAFGFYRTSSPESDRIKLLNADTLNLIKVIKTPNNLDVAFSGDGRILAAGETSLELWDVEKGKKVRVIDHPFVAEDAIWHVAFSPTEPTLAATTRRGLIFWHVNTGGKLRELKGFYDELVFSHDGTILVTTKEDKILLLNTADWSELRVLTGHVKPIGYLALSPDDKILASSEYNTVRDERRGTTELAIKLWDVETGQLIGEIKGHDRAIKDLHFSAKSDLLVGYQKHRRGSEEGDNIIFFDVAERKEILRIETKKWIHDLVFRPDGKAIVVHRSGELALYGVP